MMSGSLDAEVRWSWSIFQNEKLWNSKNSFFKIYKYVWITYRSVCLSEGNEYCLFQNQNHLHRWFGCWKQMWPRFLLSFFLKPISWFEKIEMFFKTKAWLWWFACWTERWSWEKEQWLDCRQNTTRGAFKKEKSRILLKMPTTFLYIIRTRLLTRTSHKNQNFLWKWNITSTKPSFLNIHSYCSFRETNNKMYIDKNVPKNVPKITVGCYWTLKFW